MNLNSKQSPKMPKALAALLAAIGAAGDVVAIEVPGSPFDGFEQDVRLIDPRTYARVMEGEEFSRDERDFATLMFHRSGRELFTHKVISFALDCNEQQYARLRGAFPEECRIADIVRDREGRFSQFMDRVMGLDQFIRLSPSVGKKVEEPGAAEARRPDPRDN